MEAVIPLFFLSFFPPAFLLFLFSLCQFWKSLGNFINVLAMYLYCTGQVQYPEVWGCSISSIWPVVLQVSDKCCHPGREVNMAVNLAATSDVLHAGLRQIGLSTLRKLLALEIHYICTTWRYDSDILPKSKDSTYSSH